MNKGEREMKGSMELKNELFKIDGKGYKAYKALEGRYDFKKYVLSLRVPIWLSELRTQVSVGYGFDPWPCSLG